MRLHHGLASLALLGGCAGMGPGSSGGILAAVPDAGDRAGLLTCGAAKDPLHPLIVEWEATSRAELEAAAARGPVVVRYEGCVLRVLTGCTVRDGDRYTLVPTTPAEERIEMTTAADLYARLPLGVVRLEAKLAESGGLSLRYVAVGERVLSRAPAVLEGECGGATHYVDAMVLGAFDLETHASRSGGADVRALGAGAGGALATRREIAGSAGDVARCKERDASDASCQAVLQLGLRPLVRVGGFVEPAPSRTPAAQPGIPALAVIPALGELEDVRRSKGVLDAVDVKQLELLARARGLDGDRAVASRAKATAWAALAQHGRDNPYHALAERRRDEWLRIATAEDEHLARVHRTCPAFAADKQRLERLRALDDAVLGEGARQRYERAFERTYGPWQAELATCDARAARGRPDGAAPRDGMVAIPGGTFVMGAPPSRHLSYTNYETPGDNRLLHVVAVASFAMDVTEVSVGAYRACVRARGCTIPMGPRPSECTWQSKKDDLPINCVDREQARAYCRWASKRLPTEEEWEYAARSPTLADPFPWVGTQNLYEDIAKLACWGQDTRGPCPVGSKPGGASHFGVKDMAGNVWEWTDTAYSADYGRELVSEEAVIRGGAFSSPIPEMLETTYRTSLDPRRRVGWVGFRCAE